MSDVSVTLEGATAAVYFGAHLAQDVVSAYAASSFADREANEFDIMSMWDRLSLDDTRTIAELMVARMGGIDMPTSPALFGLACDSCEAVLTAMGADRTLKLVETLDLKLESEMP